MDAYEKLIKTNSVDDTIKSGENFAKSLKSDTVVLFYGDMGAGKTHFVKGMAMGLSITDNVTSPTFSLVNEYFGELSKLIHFDLFRIKTADDLYAIGFFDYIGKGKQEISPKDGLCSSAGRILTTDRGIIAIEWAENVPELKNELTEYYTVKIERIADNERNITIAYSRT
ncbi:MAG: tRNA (adenosine(37)-N6)-threonylcarbamoyltransferase complex ATPase subunit type 1 TsaE [Oscillospiraceae bacterium]|nr:tRNA (adenosine(37)-N6)-threonylcarbamoyltransferase complex ATPase subunit type 1 TsaE [Oscillospiraceae bacterium]